MIPNTTIQTKDLASRYERNLQDSEATTEKSKARLDTTMEELGRILLQKEGEPAKDSVIQTRAPAGGKRAIGKAVAKGGLLLKGKNPGNVPSPSILCDLATRTHLLSSSDSTPGGRHPCSCAAVFPGLPQVRAGNAGSTTRIFQLSTSSDTPCQCPQNKALPLLIPTSLGFEGMRGRNRPWNTIPSHSLRFLV